MGAVFLAQQSRPRRQVAVKVLLPMAQLTPTQRAAFLERFRRETDAAASLEHPNILPVHEYGEREGLAYLVMPYVSGGTLRDEMEREQPLALPKVVNYLEQVAAALDFAHEHGVIHRDVKPANILLTSAGRLLLTDFGLVKVVSEEQAGQVQLTGIGVPMGTPDYMAPEQVIGGEVDSRADLYSLGVVLYQMVTGTTPFNGEMPMQVAMQHLHVPPPLPQSLRPELPVAAGQAILRALAKRPADRYMRALDLANAFKVAITAAGLQAGDLPRRALPPPPGSFGRSPFFNPNGLFDPMWQSSNIAQGDSLSMANTPTQGSEEIRNDIVAQTSMTLPSFSNLLTKSQMPVPTPAGAPAGATTNTTNNNNTPLPASRLRGAHKLSLKRPSGEDERPFSNYAGYAQAPVPANSAMLPASQAEFPVNGQLFQPGGAAPLVQQNLPYYAGVSGVQSDQGDQPAVNRISIPDSNQGMPSFADAPPGEQLPFAATSAFPPPPANSTGSPFANYAASAPPGISAVGTASPAPDVTRNLAWGTDHTFSGITGTLGANDPNESQGNTVKLTQTIKVVKVPIAGQPGRYMTGLLPISPIGQEPVEQADKTLTEHAISISKHLVKNHLQRVILASLAVVVLLPSLVFFLLAQPHRNSSQQALNPVSTSNISATATAFASATAEANTILDDPLMENIHNWPVSTTGTKRYVFKDGAYHIEDEDNHDSATAILPEEALPASFIYKLTMDEIKGDDTSINNQFGMILRFNSRQHNGKTVTTFYIFEVSNSPGGEYQFWKYDDSNSANPWTKLWSTGFGHEYRLGHRPANRNTFKIIVTGSKFAFTINGKRVGMAQDGSLSSGQVGMLVNMKGTEVAFSNLLLTYK